MKRLKSSRSSARVKPLSKLMLAICPSLEEGIDFFGGRNDLPLQETPVNQADMFVEHALKIGQYLPSGDVDRLVAQAQQAEGDFVVELSSDLEVIVHRHAQAFLLVLAPTKDRLAGHPLGRFKTPLPILQ